MPRYQFLFVWLCLFLVSVLPVIAAGFSPLLAWRQPIYILAGFTGILALVLLVFQPLLAYTHLPGIYRLRSKHIHRIVGGSLILLVLMHVVGLWITSPPDVVDALLFRSPTLFSVWGVIAMWALFVSGLVVAVQPRISLRVGTWRLLHKTFGAIVVVSSVVHVLLIDGTMENVSKYVLCFVVLFALVFSYKNTRT